MRNKAYTDPLQLTLPIEFAPSVVRAHGLLVAHPRPLVSYGKGYGRVFCFRTSPGKAWRYAEVEYANAGSSYGALALDCDDANTYARGFLRSEIPPPNWRVFRPDTGHSHAVWTLAAPVHKYPKARRGPLDYFAAIAEFYALTLGADAGYNGVLVHNPVASPYETRWGPELPYTLEQLARVIFRSAGARRTCDRRAWVATATCSGPAWRGPDARRTLASTCLPRCSSSSSDSRIRSRCRKCEPRRGASRSTASGGRREAGTRPAGWRSWPASGSRAASRGHRKVCS